MNGFRNVKNLEFEALENVEIDTKKKEEIEKAIVAFYDSMNDDLNTAMAIAQMFTLLKYVNMIYMNQLLPAAIGQETFDDLKSKFVIFFADILGLKEEEMTKDDSMLQGMLSLYREYKANQQYDKVDQIRAYFKANSMTIKDMKHKIDWAWEE